MARAKGKHIGRPSGVNEDSYTKVKKALEKGLSVGEIVSLTGISMSSVKRYRKQLDRMVHEGQVLKNYNYLTEKRLVLNRATAAAIIHRPRRMADATAGHL